MIKTLKSISRNAACLSVLLLVFITGAARAAEPARKPNVLYLLADQWRAAATGYAGDPNVKTPHLDRLADQSVNFIHAVSGCPVCARIAHP